MPLHGETECHHHHEHEMEQHEQDEDHLPCCPPFSSCTHCNLFFLDFQFEIDLEPSKVYSNDYHSSFQVFSSFVELAGFWHPPKQD